MQGPLMSPGHRLSNEKLLEEHSMCGMRKEGSDMTAHVKKEKT